MSAAHTRARLGLDRLETWNAAGVDDLIGCGFEILCHLLEILYQRMVLPRREVARERCGAHVFQRPSFAAPFRQSTVENDNVLVTHRAQHPPGSRSGVDARTVVYNDEISIAESEFAHPAGELRRRRQH